MALKKKSTPSGKKKVSADSRKSPREQQRIQKPSAPPPGAVSNTPKAPAAPNDRNTARQAAPTAQKKRKAPKASQKTRLKKPGAKQPVSLNKSPAPQKAPARPSGTVRRAAGAQSSVRKRHKYHGGNYILYYILAGMVIITVLAILANTVLFKCKKIVVSGNARYTAEQIAEVSGIDLGNNLLHINTRRAEGNIVAALPFIDGARVKKSFPTGINIEVTEGEKWYCVREGSDTVAISHGGKIVERCEPDGLTVITGYEPESIDVGGWLGSVTEGKSDIPVIIMKAVERTSLENVDEVDLEDRFSIKMSIEGGRVILELGTVSDMESKLMVANELIRSKISPTERVTVLLSNPIQATVRRNPEPDSSSSSPSEPELPEDTSNADNSDDSDISSKPQT